MKPNKILLITQSNYIPWKGYFDAINMADEFIIYDEMQYTKRDWRNRNKIITPQGAKWLSIPVSVKGKYHQMINETKISDPKWGENHWNLIKSNYSKAPFFNKFKDVFEDLYLNSTENYLSQINEKFIRKINNILEIDTKISRSDDYGLIEGKTERLVDLCIKAEATEYLTGPAAKDYMDETLFENEGIKINYLDYSKYPEYHQLHENFEHGVSILDLIFNTGSDAKNYLKSFDG